MAGAPTGLRVQRRCRRGRTRWRSRSSDRWTFTLRGSCLRTTGCPAARPVPEDSALTPTGCWTSRGVPENREQRSRRSCCSKQLAGRTGWPGWSRRPRRSRRPQVSDASPTRTGWRSARWGRGHACSQVRRYLDWCPFLLPSRRRSWELPGRGVLPLHCGAGDRRPEAAQASWEAGAGAVLTCDGPSGVSAQAVVALRGAGRISAITPPPGGALVLRAWRTRSTWGAACGLVLGAADGAWPGARGTTRRRRRSRCGMGRGRPPRPGRPAPGPSRRPPADGA